jgi:hypothetical protein
MLGGALSNQKQFADAEAPIKGGEDGMKRQATQIPLPAKVRLT